MKGRRLAPLLTCLQSYNFGSSDYTNINSFLFSMLSTCQDRCRKLSYDRLVHKPLAKIKRGHTYNLINLKLDLKNKSPSNDCQMTSKINNETFEKIPGQTTINNKQNLLLPSNKSVTFAAKPPAKIIFINHTQQKKQKRAESLNQAKLKMTLVFQNLEKGGRDDGENKTYMVTKRIKSSKNIRLGSQFRQKTTHDLERQLDFVKFENFYVSTALSSGRSKGSKMHKVSSSIPQCGFDTQMMRINIFGMKAMETDLVDHFRLKTAGENTRIRNKKINCLFVEDNIGSSSKII